MSTIQAQNQVGASQMDIVHVIIWHVAVIILLLGVWALIDKKKFSQLSFGDKFSILWLIFNGILIHFALDFVTGVIEYPKILADMYFELDKRYSSRDPTVIVISCLEGIMYAPICLISAVLLCKKKCQKQENCQNCEVLGNSLAIVVLTFQAFGCLIFTGQEFLRKCVDVCPPEGCYIFTMKHIFYFWVFFIVANIVWVIVPLIETIKAYRRIVNLYKEKQA